jgi:cob(I)alamin adenosyltransferase
MNPPHGLVLINTGPGKGKTTAALGAALRAAGQGLRVLIVQFIKGGGYYGELGALRNIPQIEIRPMGLGLIQPDEDLAPHQESARRALAAAREAVTSGQWDLVVLDEICVALDRGFFEPEEVVALIEARSEGVHLILTGRNCPEPVLAVADTISRIEEVRHHFASGVGAQKGIEF